MILLNSLLLFFFAFIVQLIIWRIKLPNRQTKTLIAVFFSVFIIWTIYLVFLSPFFSWPLLLNINSVAEYLHVVICFISLILAYMITYSAVEADSPSLTILLQIVNAGKEGLFEKDFSDKMTDAILVEPRLNDLVHDKMAIICSGKYFLTPKGVLLAKIFYYYRLLLNAPKGG